jgi:hypothetical protein
MKPGLAPAKNSLARSEYSAQPAADRKLETPNHLGGERRIMRTDLVALRMNLSIMQGFSLGQ